MNMGPIFFSEFGKKAKDVLTRDYSSDQKFTIFSQSVNGPAITTSIGKNGGLSSGDVSAQYSHKNAVLNVKVDTESNILTTVIITDILPSTLTVASIRLPDYDSGTVMSRYSYEHATFSMGVSASKSHVIDVSATIGTPSIAFGAETSYTTDSRRFLQYNAGISVTNPNSVASVVLADKRDSLRCLYLHQLEQLNKGAVVGEMSRKFSTNENTLTVGCLYPVDAHTLVKRSSTTMAILGRSCNTRLCPGPSLQSLVLWTLRPWKGIQSSVSHSPLILESFQ